jgi:hypothetical protein
VSHRTLGPIDAWINCAGNGTYGRFLDTPADEFQRVTEVTYMGTVNGTRVALRRFLPRDRGSIVNVCSAVAFHGMPLLSAYSGAKHAVRGFGQSVRAELSQDGSHVRLTSVFPPAVNTPFFDHAISHVGQLGRPMSPVYRTEVVAEPIRLALISGCAEMPVTSTAILFSIRGRFMPGLVARAIRKLGYGGQLTDRPTPGAARAHLVRRLPNRLTGARRVRRPGAFRQHAHSYPGSARTLARARPRGAPAGKAASARTSGGCDACPGPCAGLISARLLPSR